MNSNKNTCSRFLVALLAAVWSLIAASANAQTTTAGDVEEGEPTSTSITVGYTNDDDEPAFGQLFIDDEMDDSVTIEEQYSRLVVGNRPLAIGEVYISGAGTIVQTTNSGTGSPAVSVGDEGTGLLVVSEGAELAVTNLSNGTLEIAEEPTSFGEVFIEGRSPGNFPTRLTVTENIVVGGAGVGELTVRDGALVTHTDENASALTVGELATGSGLIVIEGSRSRYQAPELVNIGVVGVGEVRVGAGATFDANNARLEPTQTLTVGTRGYVSLQGGRFFTERATIDGRLGGDGWVSGAIIVSTTGEVSAGPGDRLRLLGSLDNSGVVNIVGTPEQAAEIEFQGTAVNNGGALPGRIAVDDGIVRFAQPLTNSGTLASSGGDTQFHGEITTPAGGRIAIGGESNATFFDNVVVPGGVGGGILDIAAGSTALFLGDLSISAGSMLAITIDESAEEDGFKTPLQVLGTTFLGVPITLELENGYVPSEGAEFQLLEATGGLVLDTLTTQSFDQLPNGLDWDVLLTDDGLIAQVVAAPVLPADYNGDGHVSAADFTIARDRGQPDDVNEWQANFGDGVFAFAQANASSASVPEPGAAVLLLLAALGAVSRRWG